MRQLHKSTVYNLLSQPSRNIVGANIATNLLRHTCGYMGCKKNPDCNDLKLGTWYGIVEFNVPLDTV